MNRRDWTLLGLAAMTVLAYGLATYAVVGEMGFPLDDAWIHQTYGRNLAQSGQWEFVPGVRSAGSTSPLYTVLLAIGYSLHVPYFLWAYLLGALALGLCSLVGARLADRLLPDLPRADWWTGLALIAAWHLIWAAASGMETMLFAALSLTVMALAMRELPKLPEISEVLTTTTPALMIRRGADFGIVGAALIATRPEGVLLIGLLVLVLGVIAARWHASWRDLSMWIAGALLGGAVGLTPYAFLNLSLNGTLLPNTFSAKQAEYAPLLAQPFYVNLWAMITPLLAGGQALLIPGMIGFAALTFRQRGGRGALLPLMLLIWPTALIVLYALRLPAYYQHGRYVMPALPGLIVAGVCGTLLLLRATRRWPIQRVVMRAVALAAAIVFVYFWGYGALILAGDVKQINSEMVAAARWLAQNVPADRLLAVHDIGAVGYFAPRPILDTAGLVSPEVIPIIRDSAALLKLMEARRVFYLLVLPDQRADQFGLAAADPRLCERYNTGGSMGGMRLYELAWDGRCP